MWSSNFFLCIQLLPTFFIVQNFQGPDFSESRFFRVRVFLRPGFSGSGSRVRVQGPGPCFRCSRLSLVFTIDFCYLQLIFFCILFKKDTEMVKKSEEIFWKKWIHQRKVRGLTFKFCAGSWDPFLNFEVGPGVPLLNFRGVPGPTFKLWGESCVLGPRVSRSRVPGSWSHFYTMPSKTTIWKILSKDTRCRC